MNIEKKSNTTKWPEINNFGNLNKFNYIITTAVIIFIYLALYLPISGDPFSYTGQIYINIMRSIFCAAS